MRGAIHPLPFMSSSRGAYKQMGRLHGVIIKHRDSLTFKNKHFENEASSNIWERL